MLRGFFDSPHRRAGHPASRPSHLIRLGLKIASRLRYGRLTIVLPGGARHEFQGTESGPSALLVLRCERAIRRFLDGGGAGFAEAYLDGDWDSPDLPRLLELLALNEAAYEEF
ncbi:MAG TPA: hypothetical protein VLE23_18710, partial [Geminicoccaceae bacterium]|nr:hypothetical protein [Geminicoccaceae bacterium]